MAVSSRGCINAFMLCIPRCFLSDPVLQYAHVRPASAPPYRTAHGLATNSTASGRLSGVPQATQVVALRPSLGCAVAADRAHPWQPVPMPAASSPFLFPLDAAHTYQADSTVGVQGPQPVLSPSPLSPGPPNTLPTPGWQYCWALGSTATAIHPGPWKQPPLFHLPLVPLILCSNPPGWPHCWGPGSTVIAVRAQVTEHWAVVLQLQLCMEDREVTAPLVTHTVIGLSGRVGKCVGGGWWARRVQACK